MKADEQVNSCPRFSPAAWSCSRRCRPISGALRPSGETVRIQIDGQTLEVLAVKGRWQATLPQLDAGGPYEMTIQAGQELLKIRDILAGEVWVAGGQSNMEWPLKHSRGGPAAIAAAQNGQIRFFNVPKVRFAEEPSEFQAAFEQRPAWYPATAARAGDCSAVGYYFARDLQQSLGVPVGVIGCNLGGSSAAAWTSREYLAKDEDVRSYLEDYDRVAANLDLDGYIAKSRAVLDGLRQFNEAPVDPEHESARPAFDPGQLPPEALEAFNLAMGPGPRCIFGHPGSLFENMLMTIVPYSVKGVIFYQGESDVAKARIYSKLFETLIDNWRAVFRHPNMPFLFVQLAAYGNDGYPDGDQFAILRDQQAEVANRVFNTGMAVAFDVGHLTDIHPRSKRPVGERLSLVARDKVYQQSLDSSGPVLRSMKIEQGRVILQFDHAGDGLACQGDHPKGFQICGPNRLYVEAQAEIRGSRIELSSPKVPMPAEASYGWANFLEANVYNDAGLPMIPFKTDRYL